MLVTNGVDNDAPKLGPISLAIAKDQALRRLQELTMEGRQVNALYICTPDELSAANQRKLAFVTQCNSTLSTVILGGDVIDFFDEVIVTASKELDTVEAQAETFHQEMSQRLERLTRIRRAIEMVSEPASAAKRPAPPVPQPVKVNAVPAAPAVPSPSEAGISSAGVLEEGILIKKDDSDTLPATGLEGNKTVTSTTSSHSPNPKMIPLSKAKVVLLFCSRNGTARQALGRFANQMNLTFEIIDYNPDQPAYVIEQLFRHRDAKFVVVYWGEVVGREMPGSAHPERYVGFVLGFVLGRLGRARAFILGSSTAPPLPGFARLLVSQLDSSGGWQIQLARRMKAAGVDIDLNKLT